MNGKGKVTNSSKLRYCNTISRRLALKLPFGSGSRAFGNMIRAVFCRAARSVTALRLKRATALSLARLLLALQLGEPVLRRQSPLLHRCTACSARASCS